MLPDHASGEGRRQGVEAGAEGRCPAEEEVDRQRGAGGAELPRRDERSHRFEEYKEARLLISYCAKDDEVQTRPIIERALEEGKRVAVVVTDVSSKTLSFSEIRVLRGRPRSWGLRDTRAEGRAPASGLHLARQTWSSSRSWRGTRGSSPGLRRRLFRPRARRRPKDSKGGPRAGVAARPAGTRRQGTTSRSTS